MPVLQPPPFRVYLMRHARAAWPAPGGRDFDRPLDNAGYAEAELIADQAADKGFTPDVVLSSTALRCRETAQAVRRAFNDTFEVSYVDEMYNAEAALYLALISAQTMSQSVMLVGHNPAMEAALETFIGQQKMAALLPMGFPTAGLAVLDAKSEQYASGVTWTLSEFLAP